MDTQTRKTVEEHARTIRHDVIRMIGSSGKVGHLGGSCSCAEIIATLYFYKMKHDVKNPALESRDRFVMSKGHSVLAQYSALAQAGYFSKDEFSHVKEYGSMLQGHPDRNKTPGIEANTGSLGQGLSVGLGMALGLRGGDSTVYVLVGDGELAEGQIWEAIMAANHYKTGNLVMILDCNGIQATGEIKDVLDTGDKAAKFEAFGWRVLNVDGHNVQALADALDSVDVHSSQPTAIIANTVKGKFVSFAEGKAQFHNAGLTAEQFEIAHKDIEAYQY